MLILRLFAVLATLTFFIDPIIPETLINQKIELATTIGAALCFSRQGYEFNFNEFIQETIIEEGVNSNLLSDKNVLKLGELIADKLGNDCSYEKAQRIAQDDQFIILMMQLIN
tara:strand:+ start:102 stop:440 length:339 start_codon:yes stop_codon:yes gene_type:complete